MQSLASIPTYLDLLAGTIGLMVGSFLSFWALRALNNQSVFSSPSTSPTCEHRLKPSEFIPLLSYLTSKGKCKHCRLLLPWYYPLVELLTALAFIVILRFFGWTIFGLAMLVFVSVLITVCITDFKEKIIPHEITYPAIILGIIFSTIIRHDFTNTLAGIGISYIFFDFLAFYGLKIYLFYNSPTLLPGLKHSISSMGPERSITTPVKSTMKVLANNLSISPPVDLIKRKNKLFDRKNLVLSSGQSLDEFEVMGGGDAVLAALISAWLGLPKLLLTLLISFIAGTVLGAIYLLVEMHKQKMLGSLFRPLALSAGLGAISFIGISMIAAQLLRLPLLSLHWLPICFTGAVLGSLIAIIQTGSRVSKPFPFGPALALGALVAMFT